VPRVPLRLMPNECACVRDRISAIEQARKTIANKVLLTQLQLSPCLSDQLGAPVHLKLEHTQITGSFKLRGATNAVASLSDAEKQRGVAGVSTGNHGRGLAHAAKAAGVGASSACRGWYRRPRSTASRRWVPRSGSSAIHRTRRSWKSTGWLVEDGMTMIPPFDNRRRHRRAGHARSRTARSAAGVETVLVPVSGRWPDFRCRGGCEGAQAAGEDHRHLDGARCGDACQPERGQAGDG
jgi:threonine dehydratase